MNYLKKLSLFLICLITFSSILSFKANASEEYYDFNFAEINTSIKIPKGLITFTKNVSSADPNLKILKASADELRVMFDKNHIYLETMPEDLSFEIILYGKELENVKDFNDMSDEEIKTALKKFEEESKKSSSDTVYNVELYKNDVSTYFVIDFLTETDVTVYARKYYTVAQGCEVSIALQTKTPSATDANDSTTYTFKEEYVNQLQDIVDNTNYAPMKVTLKDSAVFREIMGYLLGLAITIGGLGLILFLLIKTTKKR